MDAKSSPRATVPFGSQSPYQWPEGKKSAALFSVDVDAIAPFLWEFRDHVPDRLARLEIRRFGLRTGMARLLDVFRRYQVTASFYVPAFI
jgi:peptidoglycan/xylan/chitin deacetylase (PgdA/CDA1 family)